MKSGLLIILSGPSGVGKGTIRKLLMETHEELKIKYSISMTTRSPRNQEVDGVDYFFVSEEEFQKNLEADNFLENAAFVGHRYGTPKDKVEQMLEQGNNVLLEIEVNGAMQVLERWEGKNILSIFLTSPDLDSLRYRIENRKTESPEIIAERLAKAKKELCLTNRYDYTVMNDDKDRATEEVAQIIRNKLARVQ